MVGLCTHSGQSAEERQMATTLVGFFLDSPSADEAIAQLQTAGYDGGAQEGEQFDSRWQEGRIAVVVGIPGEETDPGQEAEIRALLLHAGALDIQEGAARGGDALPTDSMRRY
jgi:hypothetical protein